MPKMPKIDLFCLYYLRRNPRQAIIFFCYFWCSICKPRPSKKKKERSESTKFRHFRHL